MQPNDSATTKPAEATTKLAEATKAATKATTRRRVLRFAGAGLAAAATAGCVETLPPLGQRVRYGRVDVPEPASGAGDPVYRRWLPAASALPDDDLDPSWVFYVEPGAFGRDIDGDGRANHAPYSFQKPLLDYFGVGYENFDRVVGILDFGTTFVLEGPVSPDPVGTTLVDSGYATAGSHRGYDLYDRDGGRRTAAVRDGAIVWTNRDRARAVVEAIVDADRGAVSRHHSVDGHFALATSAIGTRRWTWFGEPLYDPDNTAAFQSMSYTYDDAAVYNVFHLVYPPGETAPEREIRRSLEEQSRAIEARAVDLQTDGPVATIEMRRSLAAPDLGSGFEGVAIPQVTWGASRAGAGDRDAGAGARDADEVTIRHEAGDPVAAERLTFAFEDPTVEDRDERTTLTDVQFTDVTDTVRPGDAITVSAPDDLSGKRLLGEFSAPDSVAASSFVVTKYP